MEVAMKWVVPIIAALIAACGAASSRGSSGNGSPIITGDSCALHEDAATCRADAQGCIWFANTRPCQVGQPCPAGWCSHSQPLDGGPSSDSGVSASAGCACPGAAGDICVMQIGGTAIQVEPQITCAPMPAICALPDRCACLAQSTFGTCRSSDQVTNLCICDNGIR
jgi:hypothetical protein